MLKSSAYVKIVVYVPTTHADQMRKVLGEAGAGVQGNYKFCSGSYKVTGRFLPLAGAEPAIGIVGKLEEVEEEAIEVICHQDLVKKVIKSVKAAHPYEEPAIDILPRLAIE